jgi:hypothetical protein
MRRAVSRHRRTASVGMPHPDQDGVVPQHPLNPRLRPQHQELQTERQQAGPEPAEPLIPTESRRDKVIRCVNIRRAWGKATIDRIGWPQLQTRVVTKVRFHNVRRKHRTRSVSHCCSDSRKIYSLPPWAAFPDVSPRLAPPTTLKPGPSEQRREPQSSGAGCGGPR